MKLLGPHLDCGSIERWEDPGFRSCFRRILEGNGGWRAHDPWDASPRVDAKQDLYNAPYVPLSTPSICKSVKMVGVETRPQFSGLSRAGHLSRIQVRAKALSACFLTYVSRLHTLFSAPSSALNSFIAPRPLTRMGTPCLLASTTGKSIYRIPSSPARFRQRRWM
jgi:hypothetical protein